MTALERFNAADEAEAIETLLACCGSRAWASTMARRRDISDVAALLQAASDIWFALPEPDWLEAFACHPRIGEVRAPATNFLAHSTGEQLQAQQTLATVQAQLLAGNQAYEAKFGFLYIVFASGRAAPELLSVLEQRLHHSRADELQEAARQQDRITRLRIERWLAS